jgi:CheY-like chemotaxis protein
MKRASFSESARRSSYPLVHSENELNAQVVQKNDQNFLGPVVSFGSRRQSLAPELFSNNDEQKKLTVRRFLSFRDIAKSQSPLESVVNPNESEPPRLLMAEDQIINQKITKKILETFGVSVDIAQNGVDALRMMSIEEEEKTQLGSDPYTYSVSKVKNNDNMRRGDDINTIDSDAVLTPGGSGRTTLFDYDLIIMDGNMPVMDGIEATRRIRRFENRYFRTNSARHNKPIPIIGLTASSEETYQAMCIDAGMDEVITKVSVFVYFLTLQPVNKKDLEYMLMRYLPENPTYGSYSTVKDFSFGST